MREFWFSPRDSVPFYLSKLIDSYDDVKLTVQDLSDPECLPEEEELDEVENKVHSDFIMFLMTPCFLRARGYSPEGLMSLRDFKEKAMGLIKSIAPAELLSSAGPFRNKIQGFLNRTLNLLFSTDNFDEAKSLVREILDVLGVDYPLEQIGEEEVTLYNTSYIFPTKILYTLGLFDPEEFRFENLNSHYLKKVPEPSLWDVKDFLEAEADFITSRFYKSFLISKKDPSDKMWSEMYDEAEKRLSLIEGLINKVPSPRARNKKGEVWELSSHDLFWSELRKKIISLAESLQLGLREEFTEFHLPENVQRKVLNPRVVYRPWKKIK